MSLDDDARTLARDNERLRDEIQRLMLDNTRLQRELKTLNGARDEIVRAGHERVGALADELRAVDEELETVRSDCDRMIALICQQQQQLQQGGGMGRRGRRGGGGGGGGSALGAALPIDEEDLCASDHSVASTASSSSPNSATSASFARRPPPAPTPPLGKKASIDIDQERLLLERAQSQSPSQSQSQRETLMRRIARSVRKAQSLPEGEQEAPQSPMLAYKALRSTHSHLHNFRRHSGPYRKNRETVVL